MVTRLSLLASPSLRVPKSTVSPSVAPVRNTARVRRSFTTTYHVPSEEGWRVKDPSVWESTASVSSAPPATRHIRASREALCHPRARPSRNAWQWSVAGDPVGVPVGVGVPDGLSVGAPVGTGVAVGVTVGPGVAVGTGVGVGVGGTGVAVGIGVAVGPGVGVGAGGSAPVSKAPMSDPSPAGRP